MRTLNLSLPLACGLLWTVSAAGEPKVSGPYTHENLSIFLIHGAAKGPGNTKNYLPLKEALEQKKVVVYETKNVNQLAIENVSGEPVFVQGGDIVKGGQQDRVISNDLVLPSKSGKVDIAAFCVEHGRWTRRGAESSQVFNSSTETISNKDIALAVKGKKDQQEVWKEVSRTQDALEKNSKAYGKGTGSGGGSSSSSAGMVRATASPSSFQLTLESKAVEDATQAYVKALSKVVDGKPDVVGIAFAVNGEVSTADTYAFPSLFTAMWPKLLKAASVEAFRNKTDGAIKSASAADVEAFLRQPPPAKAAVTRAGSTKLATWDSEKQLVSESADGEAVVHRNYIKK